VSEQFVLQLIENQRRIYGFILSAVHNFSDADDIFQETVLVMCRRSEEFRAGSSLSAWAVGIAKNKIIQFRAEQHKSRIMFSDRTFERVISRSNSMIDQIEDRVKALRNCLARLSERDKELVRMRYEMGMKIKNIAEKVGRPVQGLYQAFGRIHNALRVCVDRALSKLETTS
jgi:RNA polymerase sigma-70 factor (ECF subfamily)